VNIFGTIKNDKCTIADFDRIAGSGCFINPWIGFRECRHLIHGRIAHDFHVRPSNARSGGIMRVGLVIPTLNAGDRWRACLSALKQQTLEPDRALVIDSASTDETAGLAQMAGFEVLRIKRSEFNHGGTRQAAVEYLSDCDVIVFLTQDAIPASEATLLEIVKCLDDTSVAVAYGRQLPHQGSTSIEAHARFFSYRPISIKKDAESAKILGSKVFFCSNSFAAYNRAVFMKLGGFRRDLILGEDMEYAARAIKAGYSNFYCATAPVYHSHDYSLVQTVERYFDLGAFDDLNAWMRTEFGSHRGEGLRFIRSELRFLAKQAPAEIPRALLQSAAKLAGYRLGRLQRFLPVGLKQKLSMQPGYWRMATNGD
jgi:rhamnosyltransferase